MNLLKKASLFLACSFILSCTGTTQSGNPTPSSSNATNPSTATKIAFKDVKAVIDGKCVSCHSATRAEDGVKLDQDSLVVSRARQVNSEIQRGQMPPRSSGYTLTQEEKDLIKNWVDQGASLN